MLLHIPCGLVVRIGGFHRHGPGSFPGVGIFRSTFKILFKDVSYRTQRQHPRDDVNHWMINDHVGRINNNNHWKLLVLANIFTFYQLKYLHKREIKLEYI